MGEVVKLNKEMVADITRNEKEELVHNVIYVTVAILLVSLKLIVIVKMANCSRDRRIILDQFEKIRLNQQDYKIATLKQEEDTQQQLV